MGTSSDTGEPKNLDVSIEAVFTYLIGQKKIVVSVENGNVTAKRRLTAFSWNSSISSGCVQTSQDRKNGRDDATVREGRDPQENTH